MRAEDDSCVKSLNALDTYLSEILLKVDKYRLIQIISFDIGVIYLPLYLLVFVNYRNYSFV